MRLTHLLAQGYDLEVDHRFTEGRLDRSFWLPHYLPQWSSTEASAARYEIAGGFLHLLITADQQPWCPEFDGQTRVSSLQTGVFSGPLGSPVGQHRFTPAAVVREVQRPRHLYIPRFGAFVMRAQARIDPDGMVALWMIGFEDEPERSGEICICEIFGRDVDHRSARVGMGVHPFGDPTLRDDFAAVPLAIDVADLHEYAAVWTSEGVTFFVDDEPVREVSGAVPQYPMQLLLGIYQFRDGSRTPYPKRLSIERFRAYRPR